MGNDKSKPPDASGLRTRAEKHLQEQAARTDQNEQQAESFRIINELKIHQVELELQNEELRSARQEIEAEKTRYADLYEFAPVGYISVDLHGDILKVNLNASKVLGVDRSKMASESFELFIGVNDRPAFRQFLKSIFQDPGLATCELDLKSKDSSRVHVQLEGSVSEDGLSFNILMRDVTERWELSAAQDFLIRAGWDFGGEDFFHQLARYLADRLGMDFVCIDELEGDGLTARTVAVFHDGHFEDNISYTLKDTPCGEMVAQAVCCFAERVRHLFPRDEVLQELKAEGYAGTTLWGSNAKPIGLIAVISRKPLANPQLVESVLRLVSFRAAGEIERRWAAKELIEAKERAEAANKAKSLFLATMSHEIRTPINGMMGMLQLMNTTAMDEEQGEYVRMATLSCERLTRLLTDILDLSKIESDRLTIQAIEFPLSDIKASIMDIFGILGKQKGVEVSFTLDERLPPALVGDAARLRQILFNLVGNAVKFTDQGSVNVNVLPVSNPAVSPVLVSFIVTDTGCGIDEGMLADIFEPFVQADGSFTRRHGGAGLGLAIVKRLTGLMGGEIGVESIVCHGTVMRLTIPFGLVAGNACNLAERDMDQYEGGMRILLVEDDEINLIATRIMLEKSGHIVEVARNGRIALDLVAEKDFDCILMDIQMPVMNGVEATKAIRTSTGLREKAHIPIIAMTAYAMSGDQEVYLAAGMNDYIAKPVKRDELEAVIQRVMRKKQ